jgi:hypothetical protein
MVRRQTQNPILCADFAALSVIFAILSLIIGTIIKEKTLWIRKVAFWNGFTYLTHHYYRVNRLQTSEPENMLSLESFRGR